MQNATKGSRRSKTKRPGSVGLGILTHLLHHSKHLCIKVFLLIRILRDLRNTGVPNGLSPFTLASAAKKTPQQKKKKDKKRAFEINKCTKSPDNIQQ
jgi:hypothetical protein